MQSKTPPRKTMVAIPKEHLETSGDLRRLLKNLAIGVMHGDIKVQEAAVSVKACEQINVSLYSEIKYAAMLAAAGVEAPELGRLPLFGRSGPDEKAIAAPKP